MRDLELPGRSPAQAPTAMAATSHPLSTAAALTILQKGGNAMDAAVAACAVQCVVEPQSTGIGGDCFCLYAPEGSDEIIGYNGSGRAPGAATADWYADNGITELERQNPHSVTIPGAVDAWDRLVADHGKLSLAEVLEPAIGYARDGYPITSRVASDMARVAALLQTSPNAAAVFLKDGQTPQSGERHAQPALAVTLEKIAKEGRDGFYTGDVAHDIVSYLQGLGGLHTIDDFTGMKGGYVTPISSGFRDHEIHQCPPNGQGVIALMLLNIMSEIDCRGTPISVERIHHEIEAGRFAYRDRNLYVGDEDQADVPVDWLVSAAHAEETRQAIDPNRALSELPPFTGPKQQSTVYISVVDKDRNCCSFINTLFESFGSTLMPPKSGVMLHNRGQGFVLEKGHPNCIAPGKRPLHTIIPGMACKDGRAVMPFGVMGGQYQAFGQMQFLTRLLDYGMDIQEAQDAPRFFPDPYSGEVEIEGIIPEEIVSSLRAMGHNMVRADRPIGGSQAISINWETNTLTGGSDPRKDGSALGY